MLRKLRSLILFLLIPIWSYSSSIAKDTLIQINPQYFQVANKIFAERDYLVQKDSLSQIQINKYSFLTEALIKRDSVQTQLINEQETIICDTKNSLQKTKRRFVKSLLINIALGTLVIILIL